MKRALISTTSIGVALVLVAAACSSDDDSSESPASAPADGSAAPAASSANNSSPSVDMAAGTVAASGTTTGTAAVGIDESVYGVGANAWSELVTGDPVPADSSAEPVIISFTNVEGAPAGSFPQVREGLEAAVKEINERLGGIGGRPVELQACIHGLDPNETTNCANQVIETNPVLHINGVELLSPVVYPVLLAAGITILNAVPIFVADTNTEGVFSPNQGCLSFAGDMKYLVEETGHDRIAVISVLPVGPECYEDITKRALDVMALENEVEYEVFEHQGGDPSDDPAMIQSIKQYLEGAETPAVFFPEQASDCNEHLNLLASADVSATLLMADACNEEAVLSNPNAAGATFTIVDYAPEIAADDEFVSLQLSTRDAALDALPVTESRGSFMARGYRMGILAWTILNEFVEAGGDLYDRSALQDAFASISNTFTIGSPPIDCTTAGEEYQSVCLNTTTYATWSGTELEFGPPRNGEFVSFIDVLEQMQENAPRADG